MLSAFQHVTNSQLRYFFASIHIIVLFLENMLQKVLDAQNSLPAQVLQFREDVIAAGSGNSTNAPNSLIEHCPLDNGVLIDNKSVLLE